MTPLAYQTKILTMDGVVRFLIEMHLRSHDRFPMKDGPCEDLFPRPLMEALEARRNEVLQICEDCNESPADWTILVGMAVTAYRAIVTGKAHHFVLGDGRIVRDPLHRHRVQVQFTGLFPYGCMQGRSGPVTISFGPRMVIYKDFVGTDRYYEMRQPSERYGLALDVAAWALHANEQLSKEDSPSCT